MTKMRARDPRVAALVTTRNAAFFSALGITRDAAYARYSEASVKTGLEPGNMDSVHRLAFAALAVSGFRPRNVLELGTHFGETTAYLAELFPEARIVSVELPKDDPLYLHFHPESSDEHERKLALKLNHPNITSLRVNTAFLPLETLPEFDLIWLDGGHNFPEVAWDHAFCLKKLAAGGWIFSDDVVLPGNANLRRRPDLLDVWRVLSYFDERGATKFELLLKRENAVSFVVNPKYIGYYRKPPA